MLSCFVTDDELDPKCRVQVVAAPTIFLPSRWEPTPPLTFDQISIGGFAAALRCNAANFSSPRGASSQVNSGSRMRRLITALVLCLLHIPARAEDCVASVYALGDASQRGTKTASGTPLNESA